MLITTGQPAGDAQGASLPLYEFPLPRGALQPEESTTTVTYTGPVPGVTYTSPVVVYDTFKA